MPKRLLSTFLVVLLLLFLSCPAYAHPGRTDENGGHYDGETGEYHYHHGYPAHQHEDLDGDGILDCPYEFDDLTGTSSGLNSGTNNSSRDFIVIFAFIICAIFTVSCLFTLPFRSLLFKKEGNLRWFECVGLLILTIINVPVIGFCMYIFFNENLLWLSIPNSIIWLLFAFFGFFSDETEFPKFKSVVDKLALYISLLTVISSIVLAFVQPTSFSRLLLFIINDIASYSLLKYPAELISYFRLQKHKKLSV